MPDGALVELPDDADEALKEKIRQKVESIRAQQQPQTAAPAASPEVAPPEIKPSYFQAKAGVMPETARASYSGSGKLAEVLNNLGGAAEDVAGSLPQMAAALPGQAYQGVKFATGGPQERAQVVAEALGEAVPMGEAIQKDVQSPLGTRESFRGLANLGMFALPGLEIARELRGPVKPPVQTLSDAFQTLTEKPESPTPLSDAATKEVTNATQTGQIAESIPTERTGDDRFRPPAETGGGGGLQPATEEPVPLETREPDAARSGVEGRTSELPAVEPSPESVAATEPQPAVAIPEATAPAPEENPTTYFKGDKAEYTGNTHELHGGTFYEVKMLEGADAGKTKVVTNPPPEVDTIKPVSEAPAPKLLPGETQGDLLSSTQSEPLQLVGEKGVDYDALQKKEQQAAADRAESEKGQTTFEDLGAQLTKEEEARLKDEYEKGLLSDLQEHEQRGGDELLDAVKSLGGLRIDEPHFGDLKEAFQKKAGFSKLASGEEGYRYKDIFKKNAPGGDALVQALRAKGFDVENPGHLADMLDTRFKTGKKVYGVEARAQEGDISGLQGYAMGTAGAKEIPIRGWKEMLESGEKSPVETGDAIERAKGEVGKVLDTVGGAIRSLRDFLTVKPIPKLERAGLSDAAYEHASARNSVVHSVRHLLSRVFPDSYKNPAEMQRTGDILTKDNILGVYDQGKTRLEDAEPGTKEHDAAAEAVNKIEEAHNLAAYDRDVKEAMNDPQISKNIERWKTWVNPEMDRMYNEIKSLDPWTIQESRGRHFDARINLLPLNQAADLAKFTDMSHGMPDLVTSNYRNPNIKADPFMRRAAGTGQYSTDPGLILTNSLARRYNEVTKLRFYKAVEKTGNGFIADAGVRPTNTEGLSRLAIKMPETNPETGLTRPVEKSLWIKNDLAREARDVLNTDMSAPTNPVFKALTQVQLLQLADATAHMKNIHTVLANSLGASKPWQDAVRKLPFLSTADTVGRIASVVREVASDTPAIRDEIAQMAKQGMIRPKYPSTGIQKITKMQDAIHHVDTAARIVMNRFWDNLAERGYVTDTPAARRQFVQQIGEYNGRLMGHFSRTLRNYGASPFVVAGRTFNAFSKRLLTGDPGFKAATPQAAAMARAYQLTALTMATAVPAIINYAITGKFGGRPGTPIGAIDTGMNNEKGDKKIIDLFQLMGIRRGLRATGLGAVTEGLREGKSFNEIGGKGIEDITTTASHPWIGPGLGAMYSGISGKRLDLRGGAWPYAAKQVKEGGLKQYGENLRVTLKNQNPLLYGILAPLVGETEDTYTQGLAHGLLKAPMSAVGYVEKPGDSAFKAERSKKSSGVKVRP
jgi:hypothetical protein